MTAEMHGLSDAKKERQQRRMKELSENNLTLSAIIFYLIVILLWLVLAILCWHYYASYHDCGDLAFKCVISLFETGPLGSVFTGIVATLTITAFVYRHDRQVKKLADERMYFVEEDLENIIICIDKNMTEITTSIDEAKDKLIKCNFFGGEFLAESLGVIRTIRKKPGNTEIIPDIVSSALKQKLYSLCSIYVLPLTRETLKFFNSRYTDDNKSTTSYKKREDVEAHLSNINWFQIEKIVDSIDKAETGASNFKSKFKRIIIIDELQSWVNTDDLFEFFEFLEEHKEADWYIIEKQKLIANDVPNLFREFCVITTQNKKIGYFTYLNQDSIRGRGYDYLFTKQPWAQYRTYDNDYIKKLENDFRELEKLTDESIKVNNWIIDNKSKKPKNKEIG